MDEAVEMGGLPEAWWVDCGSGRSLGLREGLARIGGLRWRRSDWTKSGKLGRWGARVEMVVGFEWVWAFLVRD